MCHYRFKDGSKCPRPDEGKGLCFWHDPTIDKAGMELRLRLEDIAKSGESMEGFHTVFSDVGGWGQEIRPKMQRPPTEAWWAILCGR